MTTELLEIQPFELKFTFELKKQSSCSIQLGNKSNNYVAYKVKTTSPKKYCVRPNTGIVKPNGTCDFTVTMQAQSIAPPDLHCKDKFLIQSTVVPGGTTEEEITSAMFLKDGEKYIEEKKLRVLLVSPPASPRNLESTKDQYLETSVQKESKYLSGVENVPPPPLNAANDIDGFESASKDKDESRKDDDMDLTPTSDDSEELDEKKEEGLMEESKQGKDHVVLLNLTKNFKELTSKLNAVDSKLKEAEFTIMKLTEEKSKNIREKDVLKYELEILKSKTNKRNVQVGFPLLYVLMVALIGLAIGYFVHP